MPWPSGTISTFANARRPPVEELEALGVLPPLDFHVLPERLRAAGAEDVHRVIDDEVHGHLRIHFGWIAAPLRHCIAQRREVDERRCSEQVLEHHARWVIRQVHIASARGDVAEEHRYVRCRRAPHDVLGEYPVAEGHFVEGLRIDFGEASPHVCTAIAAGAELQDVVGHEWLRLKGVQYATTQRSSTPTISPRHSCAIASKVQGDKNAERFSQTKEARAADLPGKRWTSRYLQNDCS
jgi:hypothetical protein